MEDVQTKKLTATVIALDEPNTLRDRLGSSEWATIGSIKVMRTIGVKDIALLSGLAHNSLQNIDLQDASISNIPDGAFEHCDELVSISLPSCNTIPKNCFKDCIKLKNVTIAKRIATIEENAFLNCLAIQKITLPTNISIIGKKAFANCPNLSTIVCEASYPPICSNDSFVSINNNSEFYIVRQGFEEYKNDVFWKNFNLIEHIL
ncbi:MAG: leucine-rich repeat domain-containing protein [Paludibacteraceae bacterium]|nr:leucine-rich repeat domain-containing protein [Paludibacteraceae bacterium]